MSYNAISCSFLIINKPTLSPYTWKIFLGPYSFKPGLSTNRPRWSELLSLSPKIIICAIGDFQKARPCMSLHVLSWTVSNLISLYNNNDVTTGCSLPNDLMNGTMWSSLGNTIPVTLGPRLKFSFILCWKWWEIKP